MNNNYKRNSLFVRIAKQIDDFGKNCNDLWCTGALLKNIVFFYHSRTVNA